jgi:hypothetical protein
MILPVKGKTYHVFITPNIVPLYHNVRKQYSFPHESVWGSVRVRRLIAEEKTIRISVRRVPWSDFSTLYK